MNSIGFIRPPKLRESAQPADLLGSQEQNSAPEQEDRPLTVGEFRSLIYQLETRLKQHITIEISDEVARQNKNLVRELAAELLGAMDARDNFKEYEKQQTPNDEDFFTVMRRQYGPR